MKRPSAVAMRAAETMEALHMLAFSDAYSQQERIENAAGIIDEATGLAALMEAAWREGLATGHSTDNFFPDEWWPKSETAKYLTQYETPPKNPLPPEAPAQGA